MTACERVLFQLNAMKTNHLYISLLSSQNVMFVNASVQYNTATMEIGNPLKHKVYMLFFKNKLF